MLKNSLSPDRAVLAADRLDLPEVKDCLTPPSRTTKNPKISVVTISHNQALFIEEAIRSVVHQGYPNLEYIVIDAGSTDGSVEIIKKYSPYLSYWCSEPDGGPAAGLNKGFQRATGEIFGFLNADDFYLPGSLDRIARLFSTYSAMDVLCGDGYLTDVSGERRKRIFSDPWNLWRLAYGACVLVQQATFFRRDAFLRTRGFNEKHLTYWDAGLWADLGLTGAKFSHVNECLGAFRLHPNSISFGRQLKAQFRRDCDLYFQRILKRPRRGSDYAVELLLRLLKFSSHPRRTLGYKLFFYQQHAKKPALVKASKVANKLPDTQNGPLVNRQPETP